MSELVLKMSLWVSKVRWMLLLISYAVPHELLSNFVLTKWKSDQFVDAPLFQQRAFKTKHPCPEKCQSNWLCWEMALCTESRDAAVILRGHFSTPWAMFELRNQSSFNSEKRLREVGLFSDSLWFKTPTVPHMNKKETLQFPGMKLCRLVAQHTFQNVLRGSNQPFSCRVLPQHSYVFGENMSA